ncbi:MAG: hypothetical protein ACD_9C00076G0005 [uncultured bacterium]|nr:MAG: hypothetical protein ACD_9C00076G0005 [uncultured bacterium]
MSKAIVIIPVYKDNLSLLEKASLVQCCKTLRRHPLSLICPRDLDTNVYTDILKEYEINFNIVEFPPEYFAGIAGYNRLMLNINFYERFKMYEFMLIYQLDAYVFRDELDYWCSQGYDYIGAPWFEGYGSCGNESVLLKDAGNGGFSLRNIASFIDVLNSGGESGVIVKNFIDSGANEDGFFSLCAKKVNGNFNVAQPDVAMHFSFECMPEKLYEMTGKKLPFGCHAWEKYNSDFWNRFMDFKSLGIKLDSKGILFLRNNRYFSYGKRYVLVKVSLLKMVIGKCLSMVINGRFRQPIRMIYYAIRLRKLK